MNDPSEALAASDFCIANRPLPSVSQVTKFCFGRPELKSKKYTPDRFPHRRLDRQIEKMIQRLFTKATR